jgi:hypothetical protein
MFGESSDNVYFHWSRIANISTASNGINEIITYLLDLAHHTPKLTVNEALNSYGFGGIKCSFGENLLSKNNKEEFEEFLYENIDTIKKICNTKKSYAIEYLRETIGDSKEVTVIDVGWSGTCVIGLINIIESEFKNISVCGIMAGAVSLSPNSANLTALNSGKLSTYVFAMNSERINYDSHCFSRNIMQSHDFFEIFTQCQCPSFAGWDDFGNKIFDSEETENYIYISEVQKGIEDFCSDFPDFVTVSGYDAYLPFRHVASSKMYMKSVFENYTVSHSSGNNFKLKKRFKDIL